MIPGMEIKQRADLCHVRKPMAPSHRQELRAFLRAAGIVQGFTRGALAHRVKPGSHAGPSDKAIRRQEHREREAYYASREEQS